MPKFVSTSRTSSVTHLKAKTVLSLVTLESLHEPEADCPFSASQVDYEVGDPAMRRLSKSADGQCRVRHPSAEKAASGIATGSHC